MLEENQIAKIVVDSAFQIHKELGPGLLETVYEKVLTHELEQRGLLIETQKTVKIQYKNMTFDNAFKADMVVNNLVIIELKSVENIIPLYKKQLLTYLRLTNCRLGLLVNFGAALIKDGIARVANGLPDEY
jgi:GxxExxY protein